MMEPSARPIPAFDHLSPTERDLVLEVLEEWETHGVSETAHEIEALVLERPLLPIATWLNDPYFVGLVAEDLYPCWKRDLIEFFEGDYWLAVFTGAIGTGKCLLAGTLVPTSAGVLPIEDVVANGPGPMIWTHEARLRPIGPTHVIGTHPTVKVVTKYGFELEGRADHRVRVLAGDGIVWKRLEDITVGDVTILQRGTELWGETDLCMEEAEALGVWTGDGHFDKRAGRPASIIVSVGDEPEGYRHHVEHLLLATGGRLMVRRKRTAWCLQLSGVEVIDRWRSWGCVSGAHHKRIPRIVLRSPRSSVAAFLRGLFDADGTVGHPLSKADVSLCTVSNRLAYEVQVLLLNFGIVSSRVYRPSRGRGSWHVQLVGRAARERFASEIGFSHPSKRARLFERLSARRLMKRPGGGVDIALHGVADLMKRAWAQMPSPKDPSRTFFSSRWGRQNVSIPVARKVVALLRSRGGEVPAALGIIVDRDYLAVPIERIDAAAGMCYDLSVPGDESYVAAGFVSHNTTAAMVGFMRSLYELSCYRQPSRSVGLGVNAPIYLANLSITGQQAKRAAYSTLEGLVSQAPYFADVFAPEPGIKSELRFPKRITVFPGTGSESSILGLNVVGGLVDEANLMAISTQGVAANRSLRQGRSAFDQAQTLFESMVRRSKSRFLAHGRLPIKMFVVSSKVYLGEFTEQLEGDAKTDRGIFVRSYSLWDVKPKQYSQAHFQVEVGTAETRSRVLTASDGTWLEGIDPARIVGEVVQVPMDFYQDFLKDPDGALRDFAGRSTVAVTSFMQNRQHIIEATRQDFQATGREHPCSQVTLVRGTGGVQVGQLIAERLCVIGSNGAMQPRWHPESPRVIHLDPARTQDSYGFAMGCAPSTVVVERRVNELVTLEEAPLLWYDLLLKIVPPPGGEIDFAAVRDLIYLLRSWGFAIEKITYDSWQTVDTEQRLRDAGFVATGLSVDTSTQPYLVLKQAYAEGRVRHYRYWPAINELLHLQLDLKRKKVDHPLLMRDEEGNMTRGSKDVADAMAGVAFSLSTLAGAQPSIRALGQPERAYDVGEVILTQPLNADALMRAGLLRVLEFEG